MNHLPRAVESAPVIEEDGYEYAVLPISNGVPTLSPEVLREVVVGIARVADLDVDKIVTPETMGIHVSTAVTLETDVPLVVIRRREYGLDGEVVIERGAEDDMYVNDVDEGDRVLVLDDLVATGSSVASVVDALDGMGATVAGVVAVARRVDVADALADSPHGIRSLVDIEVRDGAVSVVGAYDDDR